MSEDPRCQFDECTQEATIESLVSTVDQTYSKTYCEKHKQDGTNALTNEVAAFGKPPRAWDTRLTGAGLREKEEDDRKLREEAEIRHDEWVREMFYCYGWKSVRANLDDALVLPKNQFIKGCHLRDIDKNVAYERFVTGWTDARKKVDEQGQAVFLLSELICMMQEGDEWYGLDFDEPMALVERVIDHIQKKEGSGE